MQEALGVKRPKHRFCRCHCRSVPELRGVLREPRRDVHDAEPVRTRPGGRAHLHADRPRLRQGSFAPTQRLFKAFFWQCCNEHDAEQAGSAPELNSHLRGVQKTEFAVTATDGPSKSKTEIGHKCLSPPRCVFRVTCGKRSAIWRWVRRRRLCAATRRCSPSTRPTRQPRTRY